MTESTEVTSPSDVIDEGPEDQVETELDVLKARALLMGIKHNPNIGVDKLRDKINKALEVPTQEKKEEAVEAAPKVTKTKEQLIHDQTQARKRIAAQMVRIRLTCMNPNKANWEGEYMSVGNALMGTFKRYVPFNAEDGWHVERCIYEFMKNRKYTAYKTIKGRNNAKLGRKPVLLPEFAIEVMPMLSKDELKDLEQRQAMNGSIDTE